MNNENTSDSPHFISLNEAAEMTKGTRITFIPGVQALYAEALKNICFVKNIPVIRALHPVMGIDKDTGEDRQARLYELTSQTGLPTMFRHHTGGIKDCVIHVLTVTLLLTASGLEFQGLGPNSLTC